MRDELRDRFKKFEGLKKENTLSGEPEATIRLTEEFHETTVYMSATSLENRINDKTNTTFNDRVIMRQALLALRNNGLS